MNSCMGHNTDFTLTVTKLILLLSFLMFAVKEKYMKYCLVCLKDEKSSVIIVVLVLLQLCHIYEDIFNILVDSNSISHMDILASHVFKIYPECNCLFLDILTSLPFRRMFEVLLIHFTHSAPCGKLLLIL